MPELLSELALQTARQVVGVLRQRRQTVATAESLTAGLCAAALTSVPGSSAVFRGGLIVYATDLKGTLAGVPQDLLDTYGPVAEPTARYLARGAAARTASDWGVGLTGVAGPDPQDGHPVGEVWVATGTAREASALRLSCDGDRHQIRSQAVEGALRELLHQLGEH